MDLDEFIGMKENLEPFCVLEILIPTQKTSHISELKKKPRQETIFSLKF